MTSHFSPSFVLHRQTVLKVFSSTQTLSQVLLLDEPLAGLDWKARMEVADVLKDLKKNCTILVVSHDLRELTPLVSA